MEKEKSLRLVKEYEKLVQGILREFVSEETSNIENPELGTVKDGCKKFYANECRKMLVELLSDYYSVENASKIIEYKKVLKNRVMDDYNYEKHGHTTELIAKNWAVMHVLTMLERAELNLTGKITLSVEKQR